MPLVEIAEQRLDARAERPPRLQARRIGPRRLGPAVCTGHGVLPALDRHWRHGRQLGGLAAAHPASARLRQALATARARTRAALDNHVRLAAHPANADVPALRTGLSTPTGRTVRLLPARWGTDKILRRLHRSPRLRQLLFQLPDLLVAPLDRCLALRQFFLLTRDHLGPLGQELLATQSVQRLAVHHTGSLTEHPAHAAPSVVGGRRRVVTSSTRWLKSADSARIASPAGRRMRCLVRSCRPSR
jgi:hypothetical protein